MSEEKEKYEIEDLISLGLMSKQQLLTLLKLENDVDFINELIDISKKNKWGDFKGELISSNLVLLKPEELLYDKYKYLQFDKFNLTVLHQQVNYDKNDVINLLKEFVKILPKMEYTKKIIHKYVKKESAIDRMMKSVIKNYDKNKDLLN